MNYGIIENGTVVNIIDINRENEHEFDGAVQLPAELNVEIGDTYQDGEFYRNGEKVISNQELFYQALSILLGNGGNEDEPSDH